MCFPINWEGVSDKNLLGIVVYQWTMPGKTEAKKAIKSTKTRSLKNVWFSRFRLGFISCFVCSFRGGRTGKPRALPPCPPLETRSQCAHDSRWYCTTKRLIECYLCQFVMICLHHAGTKVRADQLRPSVWVGLTQIASNWLGSTRIDLDQLRSTCKVYKKN